VSEDQKDSRVRRLISTEREALWRRVALDLFLALGSPQFDYPSARAQQIFNGERDINPGFANRLVSACHDHADSLRLRGAPVGHRELTEELNAAAAMLEGIRRELTLRTAGGDATAHSLEYSEATPIKKVAPSPVLAPPPPPEATAEPTVVVFMNRLRDLHVWRGLSLRALETAAEKAGVRLRRSTISDALRSSELIDRDLLDRLITAIGLSDDQRRAWMESYDTAERGTLDPNRWRRYGVNDPDRWDKTINRMKRSWVKDPRLDQ
jgi:hypothetical protein